jgi:predicted metalloprotease with PDZ domain
MKIYWSGAIVALMADVELRRRSGGRESLDIALGQLQHCCLPSARSWSGTELFEKLDGFVDEPVFIPLYRKYADESGFPGFEAILEGLGVTVRNGTVRLSNDAKLAGIRKAITGTYIKIPHERP